MLGKFEEVVLLGVLGCSNNCHAADLVEYLTVNGFETIQAGAVVTTLKRLELKLLIFEKPGPASSTWRGKVRMLYSVTLKGRLQLKRSLVTTGRLVAKAVASGEFELKG